MTTFEQFIRNDNEDLQVVTTSTGYHFKVLGFVLRGDTLEVIHGCDEDARLCFEVESGDVPVSATWNGSKVVLTSLDDRYTIEDGEAVLV